MIDEVSKNAFWLVVIIVCFAILCCLLAGISCANQNCAPDGNTIGLIVRFPIIFTI